MKNYRVIQYDTYNAKLQRRHFFIFWKSIAFGTQYSMQKLRQEYQSREWKSNL